MRYRWRNLDANKWPREVEVLRLIAQGATNRAIADARARAEERAGEWLMHETLARRYLARGRLTGSFDDYAAANAALAQARRSQRQLAKPTADQQRRVPHHLIDLAEPDEEFSVSAYLEAAHRVTAEIEQRCIRMLADLFNAPRSSLEAPVHFLRRMLRLAGEKRLFAFDDVREECQARIDPATGLNQRIVDVCARFDALCAIAEAQRVRRARRTRNRQVPRPLS